MADTIPAPEAESGFDGLDVSADERRAAERLSRQIDELLEGRLALTPEHEAADPRLAVAVRLSRLPALLPAVGPDLRRRVLGVRPDGAASSRRLHRRLSMRTLSLVAVAVIVVFAVVLTVPGQTALARLAAMFQLESVQVGINTPVDAPVSTREVAATRIERPFASVELVQAVAPVDILVPADLPEWSLKRATAVYYPDLPAEVPLNVVLTYESRAGGTADVVEYFVRLGDNLTVDELRREDAVSTSARQIALNGRTAILVESGEPVDLYTLIWQQDGLLVEVDAQGVTLQELTLLAESLRPVE